MQKNEAISSFCYGDMFDFKILQSDWPKAFWPISLEPNFSKILDLCWNIAYNINFHYRPNLGKIKDHKFFQKYHAQLHMGFEHHAKN